MTLITWYLTKWRFYSDLAVAHVEGLTTPWPHLGTFLPIWGRFYVWVLLLGSATAQGVTFWVPTHAPNDENQLKVAFNNEEQDHSPSHLKFFMLIFAKDKAQAQAQTQEGQSPQKPKDHPMKGKAKF